MSTFKIAAKSIKTIAKKPAMLIYTEILLLIIIFIDYKFFDFSSIIMNLIYFSKNSVLNNIVTLLSLFIVNKNIIFWTISGFAIIILFTSILFTIFFSNIFTDISDTVYGNTQANPKKSKIDMYGKMFVTFLKAGSLLVLLTLGVMIAGVPAIILTSYTFKLGTGYVALGILIDVISILVIALVYYYVKMYLVFWFPAKMKFKKAFKVSKTVVNNFFRKLLFPFIVFDLFLLFGLMVTLTALAIKNQNMILSIPFAVLGSFILTVDIIVFFSFVFNAFKLYTGFLKNQAKN